MLENKLSFKNKYLVIFIEILLFQHLFIYLFIYVFIYNLDPYCIFFPLPFSPFIHPYPQQSPQCFQTAALFLAKCTFLGRR